MYHYIYIYSLYKNIIKLSKKKLIRLLVTELFLIDAKLV